MRDAERSRHERDWQRSYCGTRQRATDRAVVAVKSAVVRPIAPV